MRGITLIALIREEIELILTQVQIGNYISNNDNTTNLENAFKTEDNNARVTKSNAVYEVTFKERKFLVSDCYRDWRRNFWF